MMMVVVGMGQSDRLGRVRDPSSRCAVTPSRNAWIVLLMLRGVDRYVVDDESARQIVDDGCSARRVVL